VGREVKGKNIETLCEVFVIAMSSANPAGACGPGRPGIDTRALPGLWTRPPNAFPALGAGRWPSLIPKPTPTYFAALGSQQSNDPAQPSPGILQRVLRRKMQREVSSAEALWTTREIETSFSVGASANSPRLLAALRPQLGFASPRRLLGLTITSTTLESTPTAPQEIQQSHFINTSPLIK